MHGYNEEKGEYIKLEKKHSCIGDGLGWNSVEVKLTKNKELVFIALCAVVEYLCELDKIPNVMDYTKLFETENNQPKYSLHEN